MKVPHPRILAVSAGSLAMAVGASATMASASVSAPSSRPVSAAPAASAGSLTSKVTGTFTNAAGKGAFTGTFTPKKFSVVNGVLYATGVLKGSLVDANGKQLGTVNQTVTDAVNTKSTANAPLACSILNLILGPLHLNVLGLVVDLNQVHLTITAVPGPGNLLGNLLCSIAGLLNGGGSLTSLSALLNSLLAALGL